MQLFDEQRHRGTEGFGLFDGSNNHLVHAAEENRILNWLVKDKNQTDLILFHHRLPTSTINVRRAAHPFSTKDFFEGGDVQYILVHNGSIRNAKDRFADHLEMGIQYQSLLDDDTFNDSEALLWDFALYMEGDIPEMKTYGGIAFVCLKLVKGQVDRLYFGRNSNPLNLYRDKHGLALSSEGPGDPIDSDMLYTWNYKLKRLTKRKLEINQFKPYDASEFSGYSARDYEWSGGSSYTPGSFAGRASRTDDSAAYDNWWNNKTDTGIPHSSEEIRKAGNWLGDQLRRKFAEFFDDNGDLITAAKEQEIIRQSSKWEVDPVSNLVVPADDYTPLDRDTAAEMLIKRLGTMPTEEEVTTEYMAYLASVKGHFEQAYWALEVDYEAAENTPDTVDNVRKRVLIEKVMERLCNDDEYQDQESVSSIWEAIWHTNQNQTKLIAI
jgi:hypothetical protein